MEQASFIRIQQIADRMMQQLSLLLKPFSISATQYNALRILRGADAGGLPCGEVAARMVTKDPDISRLFDRLEARGFVERTRHPKDRRIVIARISDEGREALAKLDAPVADLHRRQFANLDPDQLATLVNLLAKL